MILTAYPVFRVKNEGSNVPLLFFTLLKSNTAFAVNLNSLNILLLLVTVVQVITGTGMRLNCSLQVVCMPFAFTNFARLPLSECNVRDMVKLKFLILVGTMLGPKLLSYHHDNTS